MNQTLSPQGKGLNLHLFNGAEQEARRSSRPPKRFPCFHHYRFVLVDEADQMNEEEVERFAELHSKAPIRRPVSFCCGQSRDAWKKHQAKIEKVGKVMEYPRLKG